jgi:hypothetical protein
MFVFMSNVIMNDYYEQLNHNISTPYFDTNMSHRVGPMKALHVNTR